LAPGPYTRGTNVFLHSTCVSVFDKIPIEGSLPEVPTSKFSYSDLSPLALVDLSEMDISEMNLGPVNPNRGKGPRQPWAGILALAELWSAQNFPGRTPVSVARCAARQGELSKLNNQRNWAS